MITLHYLSYSDLVDLNSDARIKKIIGLVKDEKIVLMQGRLKPNEEAKLIQKTMEDVSRTFKGIELCTVYPEGKKNQQMLELMKRFFIKTIIGDRDGITIIGPASIVKEIKRDPNKIELLTKNQTIRKKKVNGRRR